MKRFDLGAFPRPNPKRFRFPPRKAVTQTRYPKMETFTIRNVTLSSSVHINANWAGIPPHFQPRSEVIVFESEHDAMCAEPLIQPLPGFHLVPICYGAYFNAFKLVRS